MRLTSLYAGACLIGASAIALAACGGPYVRVECQYLGGASVRNCTTVTYQDKPAGWDDMPDCTAAGRPPNPRANVFCRPT